MSTVGSALNSCPDLQDELDLYFSTCNASKVGDISPFVQFLFLPENRSGIQNLVVPAAGKIRNVQLRYSQAIPESQVVSNDSCDRTCTATTKRGDLVHEVTLDPCDKLEVEELISAQDFYYACRNNFDIITDKIAILVNALRAGVQTKLVREAVGMKGKWASTVGESGLNVTSDQLVLSTLDNSGKVDPNAIADFDLAILQNQYCTRPAVFTGATWYRYMRMLNIGCCSDQGIDLKQGIAAYGQYPTFFDRRVQSEWSVNEALIVQPGAIQVLEFAEFMVDAEMKSALQFYGSDYATGIISDPMTGMLMNILVKDSCGNISIVLHTVNKLVNMPSDMFPTGHFMDGVNFVNELVVQNA